MSARLSIIFWIYLHEFTATIYNFVSEYSNKEYRILQEKTICLVLFLGSAAAVPTHITPQLKNLVKTLDG